MKRDGDVLLRIGKDDLEALRMIFEKTSITIDWSKSTIVKPRLTPAELQAKRAADAATSNASTADTSTAVAETDETLVDQSAKKAKVGEDEEDKNDEK